MNKFLIAGLGNPGTRYANTRHNAGTDLVNFFLENNSLKLKENKSIKGRIGAFEMLGREVFFLIPTIFMNHSGMSLKPAIKKLNVPLDKVENLENLRKVPIPFPLVIVWLKKDVKVNVFTSVTVCTV